MNKICVRFQLRLAGMLLAAGAIVNTATAQYYYKDIVVTAQISAQYQLLRDNKVTQVTLTPSAQDPSRQAVTLQQTVYPSQRLVVTHTKVPDAPESWLKSYYNEKGWLVKTVDSSEDVVTSSVYQYDAASRLGSISSKSVPVNDPVESELHQWSYGSNGLPVRLLKIKNGTDTTIVDLIADDQNNVAEERVTHKRTFSGTTYYYYDAQHRLTDVARYNLKARRILPDYMFEYNNALQLTQMIIVPEGSADYQTWKYVYNQQGLKEKELCYNKQKQLVAGIEYTYSLGR